VCVAVGVRYTALMTQCIRINYYTNTPTHTHNLLQYVGPCVLLTIRSCTLTLPYQPTQNTATPCNALQHTATHCNTLQHTATPCNTLQHTATPCNTLQYTAIHCMQHTAHCNALQHTATHCNTLQHTTIPTLPTTRPRFRFRVEQRHRSQPTSRQISNTANNRHACPTQAHTSGGIPGVLQCAIMCFSVCFSVSRTSWYIHIRRHPRCRSVLQCVAVWSSVLQCLTSFMAHTHQTAP